MNDKLQFAKRANKKLRELCRHECGEYTKRKTAIGKHVFRYTTCKCGTWYMNAKERHRFSVVQHAEEIRRGLSPQDGPRTESPSRPR